MDFSWESPGLPVSDFLEPKGMKRVLLTPRALDLVRPECIRSLRFTCLESSLAKT